MCPDPQLLSIYMDGELPAPWKEKLESHLAQCSGCREKLESFNRLFEKTGASAQLAPSEREMMEAAKDRVWQNLQPIITEGNAGRRFMPQSDIWRRRISIPLPAAAAAAIVLVILAALWIRGGQVRSIEPASHMNMILAAEEDMPGIIPADMNSVLQYLNSDGTDIIILRLPESRNFISSGEPAIIKAADYSRRGP
jgi:hypothetical protein